MLDARDGFGKPVRRALLLAKAEDHRVFTAHTTPLLRRASTRFSLCNSSYIHVVHRVIWSQQSRTKNVDNLQVPLFASQTGCEQRTLERLPSSLAVLRCGQSGERGQWSGC